MGGGSKNWFADIIYGRPYLSHLWTSQNSMEQSEKWGLRTPLLDPPPPSERGIILGAERVVAKLNFFSSGEELFL